MTADGVMERLVTTFNAKKASPHLTGAGEASVCHPCCLARSVTLKLLMRLTSLKHFKNGACAVSLDTFAGDRSAAPSMSSGTAAPPPPQLNEPPCEILSGLSDSASVPEGQQLQSMQLQLSKSHWSLFASSSQLMVLPRCSAVTSFIIDSRMFATTDRLQLSLQLNDSELKLLKPQTHTTDVVAMDCQLDWLSKPDPESVVTASVSSSSSGTCRTWGSGGFRTFDDNFYHFTSNCDFTLSSICQDPRNLDINVRRGSWGQLEHIYMEIEGVNIVVEEGIIKVKDKIVTVPYDDKVISIQPYGINLRISNRKQTVSVLWNFHDALSITLDAQYQGELCGLCRDFKQVTEIANEVFDVKRIIFSSQLSESDDPCLIEISEKTTCSLANSCSKISSLFTCCIDNPIMGKYIEICQKDACCCDNAEESDVCPSFEEVARLCTAAHDNDWQEWRKSLDCALCRSNDKIDNFSFSAHKACPGNQIYKVCGPACMPTCTNPNAQQQCDQCVSACDCPEGTVLDNIRNTDRCIKQTECPCTSGGSIYLNGQTRVEYCQKCICQNGEWVCSDINCPHLCKFEEGSHITTFDGKSYQLMGDCSYIAAYTDEWLIKVDLHPCHEGHKQICLESVEYTYTEVRDS
ncbi:mucin-6-like [Heterodontus francisci]|uniref:mucin-6-like n=1 Tax=Heterodontus francisci TaxID=7792 RepID=UPI00355B253B